MSYDGKEIEEKLKRLPGEEVVRLVIKLIDGHHRVMSSDAALVELVRIHGPSAAPEVQRGIRASLNLLRKDLTGEECAS